MSENEEVKTDELEKESAAEEEIDEIEEDETAGAVFYSNMKARGLVDDGDWDDLTVELKAKWNVASEELEPSF